MARRVDLGSLPQHLAQAKNLAIRSTKGPLSTASSPSLNNGSQSTLSSASLSAPSSTISTADSSPANPAVTSLQRQRTKSKSKSNSPTSTPVRFPSPGQGTSESAVPSKGSAKHDSSRNGPTSANHHSHGTRSNEVIVANGANTTATTTTASTGNTVADPDASSPPPATLSTSGTSGQSDSDLDLQPIELVRVGVGILNQLARNTFSKSFITKVPQSIANYHVLIKKPMDLWTIEQKLWKTLEAAGAKSGAPSSAAIFIAAAGAMSMGVSEFYNNLAEFERDLRKIYQNATFFNAATHAIYKEAQAFQNSYLGQLENYREG